MGMAPPPSQMRWGCNLHLLKWDGCASSWAIWALLVACNILVCHMMYRVILCYIILCSLTGIASTSTVWWSYLWGCDIHLLEWGEWHVHATTTLLNEITAAFLNEMGKQHASAQMYAIISCVLLFYCMLYSGRVHFNIQNRVASLLAWDGGTNVMLSNEMEMPPTPS